MSSTVKVCAAEGCDKPSSMRCPTCKDLNVQEESFFCSKDCFQKVWELHKLVHKKAKESQNAALAILKNTGLLGGNDAFRGFEYTGKLRPGKVSPQMTFPAEILAPDYAITSIPKSELMVRGQNVIPVLEGDEIEKMREICRIGRLVLDECARALRVGITTDEIDKVCYEACIKHKVYPSPLNYNRFPKTLCTSINEVICHGIPDDRPLEDGDIINLDISVYGKDGYHTDLNETYFIGNVDEVSRRLVQCSYESLEAAIKMCQPGRMYRDLGNAIQKVANSYGFSVVRAFCGHGVGKLFHGAPNVPHYAKNKAMGIMRPGHVFTIEPMINVGTYQEVTWPDNWTSTTADGKRSSQFEHTILITETGYEILTKREGFDSQNMPWKPEEFQIPSSS